MSTRSSFNLRKLQRLAVSLLLCAFLAAAFTALAQSGRRIPKQPSSPDPKPPAESEPPIAPSSSPEPASGLPILVVKNLATIGSSSILTSVALDGCLEELKQSRAVQVSSGKDMNRKEATDYAKASKNSYVLLIQLDSETADPGNVTGANPRSLYVSYIVFTPATGKIKTQGRVFQGQSRGPLGVPVPNTTASSEYELRRCGREVAERVLDALDIGRR